MKKTMTFLFVVAALLLALNTSALAAQKSSPTAGASFECEASGAPLTFNMSPSVFGSYWTEGTTGNEQWYAIGTFHAGGTYAYATAQNFTSVYKRTLPTDAAPTVSTAFAGVVTTPASAGTWSDWYIQ